MKANELFEELDRLVDAIHQKQIDIETALEEDKRKYDQGEIAKTEQESLHASRYSELKELNEKFENLFQETADKLFSKEAESNPLLANRIEKLKRQEATSSDIYTYGSDRVKQLKTLFESIHNID